ncbi:isocitrate lyase/PEP mutase family protein [Hyphococcus luteus]|uniref:2,3-dimethylmalate lyase n=1 Tax=Hyphococcus luteus TaxID=2058213 RepID=A0A2S7K595_9PROT|nr:isocitrate lyase/PEP mutase family protein [Marinicaulis flavus]PQA87651.1 2,3-dimethylmalate lyase [Marinicaulis flavus]
MPDRTIHEALKVEDPLIVPIAHDALSARLIEKAGFHVYSIGGFALAGVRHALPDVGVLSFGEFVNGVCDIMGGSSLPVIVDGDDGYGDVKNVTRTVQSYEAMGVAGLVLEDQTNPKRCGHMDGKSVVPLDVATRKLEAALAARRSSDFFIVGRTDARSVTGLDDAITRARRFADVGVDAVIVEAPQSVEELKRVGGEIDCIQFANMAEAGRTPILPPKDLKDMGFSIIVYPGTLLLRVVKTVCDALDDLRQGTLELPEGTKNFAELTELFELSKWRDIDDKFGGGER